MSCLCWVERLELPCCGMASLFACQVVIKTRTLSSSVCVAWQFAACRSPQSCMVPTRNEVARVEQT
eukprot:6247370-Amphidinium_carterae.1